jgi:hypothetical protein
MKSEHNNNEMPSPEDFWPEAKDLLDSHFAKRKRWFLYFAGGLLLIISTIGIVFNNQKNNVITASLNQAKTKLNSNQIQVKNTTHINNKKIKTDAPVVNESNETSTKLENQNTTVKNNTQPIIVSSYSNSNNFSSTKIENQPIETKTDQKRNNFKNENLIIASTSKIENNRQSAAEEVKIDLSNTHQTVELPTNNETVEAQRGTDAIVFSKMPLLSFKMIEQKLNHMINENKYEGLINDDYFNNKKKFHYFISAYAGMQAVNKQIKADPMFTEYADIRNTSEKKINTTYFGINLTIENKDLMFQTGIEYNAIGEQNNYKAKSKQWMKNDEKVWDVYNKQIIKIDTVYHFGIVNYNQTIVNVKDSTLLTKSDSIFAYQTDNAIAKANAKTTINYLEIPLMVGYQFKFGNLAIAPFAGISVGYLTKSQGMYMNKTITGIEEINDANLITTFNFNYQLKLQLGYNINDNFMLTLTPQYRNNLFSVSPKSSEISTKYSTIGASFGLSYKL